MTINPIKRVRRRVAASPLKHELSDTLRAMAELPPSPEIPYLTVSLDWRPEGSDPEYRSGLRRFEDEANAILQPHWPRGPVYDSLSADIERINHYLTEEIDASAHGVFIVANHSQGVFRALPVGLPLETRISAGPTPALLPLARLDEDHPTYGVLVADQQASRLSLIAHARRVQTLEIASSDYPRKQQTGGWSQRRMQQRADERRLGLARRIASEVEEHLDRTGVDMLIIAGDEVITSALDEVMSDSLRELIIGQMRLDNEIAEKDLIDETMPVAEEAEREREIAVTNAARDAVGADGMGTAGARAVLDALLAGQVEILVMNDDFHAEGWADFEHAQYGIDGAESDDTTPIDVEEEFVRLAIQTSAEIDIIHSAVPVDQYEDGDIPDAGAERPRSEASRTLEELGGVAALLRYRVD
jgi:peptide subunit release factor 1 (eRF1)